MKRIFIALAIAGAFTTAANAQQAATAAPTQEAKPQMSKEEKAKMKQKQEDDMMAAFKEAGLTDEQVKQIKEANEMASNKSKEVKKDATLADDAKKLKWKEISDEKNNKLKEIMGKDKYKIYTEARKKQKEAAGTPAM
ncbi:MAG: hypothetical protein H7178_00475 [Chitinophagaceae bacterium]|nr:hypothetical protein [Chitinophagaceae bacterium]